MCSRCYSKLGFRRVDESDSIHCGGKGCVPERVVFRNFKCHVKSLKTKVESCWVPSVFSIR